MAPNYLTLFTHTVSAKRPKVLVFKYNTQEMNNGKSTKLHNRNIMMILHIPISIFAKIIMHV